MDFPLGDPQPFSMEPQAVEAMVSALGLEQAAASNIVDLQLCCKTRKLLVVFSKIADFLHTTPNPSAFDLLSSPFIISPSSLTIDHFDQSTDHRS